MSHCYYILLVFPSFMLFARESSRKLLMRVSITDTLARIMSDDVGGPYARIDYTIANRKSSGNNGVIAAVESLLSSTTVAAVIFVLVSNAGERP